MADSTLPSAQYAASHLLESCGAILFHLPTKRVCILHNKRRNYWGLAKGRRNCTEARSVAAIREVTEETGFSCHLLDVTIQTRCPPLVELDAHTPDKARPYHGSTEPFMMTTRVIGEGQLKLIWWFIASIDEDNDAPHNQSEESYEVVLLSYEDAVARLTFLSDRKLVKEAIKIVSLNV